MRASRQPHKLKGKKHGDGAEAEELHQEVGDDGAGPAENVAHRASVALLRLGSSTDQVASAAVTTACHDDEAEPDNSCVRRAEKATQGVGQPVIGGRGSAGRAHWEARVRE